MTEEQREEPIQLADGRQAFLCINNAGLVDRVRIERRDGSIEIHPFAFSRTIEEASEEVHTIVVSNSNLESDELEWLVRSVGIINLFMEMAEFDRETDVTKMVHQLDSDIYHFHKRLLTITISGCLLKLHTILGNLCS